MSTMGRYCKAYPIQQLRRYPNWPETIAIAVNPDEGTYLFLQDNYTVTAGVFIDEKIIFDQVTDSWRTFCENELHFSIPEYVQEVALAQAH